MAKKIKCARCKRPAGEPWVRITQTLESSVVGTVDEEVIDLCAACSQVTGAALARAINDRKAPVGTVP